MLKRMVIIIASLTVLASSALWSKEIRKPVWAGQFYPENPEVLSQILDFFFEHVERNVPPVQGVIALIAPHAGYVYSGQVAAHAYALVKGKDYETIIVLAPSHRHGFSGCSIYPEGGYETPLGTVEVDEQLAAELSKASGFTFTPKAHAMEHALEVQIPFIQKALPKAKIVPVVMGFPTKKTIVRLADALTKVLRGRKALVVASTDLSHFLTKNQASALDAQTISLIQSSETDALIKKVERRENIMCGGGPVVSALLYAKSQGSPEIRILKYADSSAAGGSESQVVGYLAAAVVSPSSPAQQDLTPQEKEELLQLAREAIALFIQENKVLEYHSQNPRFQVRKGVFVTLKKKGQLRGCVGFIESPLPLGKAVVEAAVYAACKDSRFQPVSTRELKDLEIELSLLTPLKKIKDPDSIQVGKHGLVIAKGDRTGLLLPQVPVEHKWSKETFLKQACMKAGLPSDAWKSGTDIFVFEADVFHQRKGKNTR